jgi:hypothetical protein
MAMKRFLIGGMVSVLLHAMPPPIPSLYLDDAYKAYKAHQYKEAFRLYSNAVAAIEYSQDKRDNFKALYNLARFYDKGIGTKKDKIKAALYYYKAYTIFQDDVYNDKNICKDTFVPYYIRTMKRLYVFEQNYIYQNKANYLERECGPQH